MNREVSSGTENSFFYRPETRANQKLSLLCDTNQLPESKEQLHDAFSCFLYRDHVTRNRYEISKLKSFRKVVTVPDEPEKAGEPCEVKFYADELRMLQTIRQNRNKDLLEDIKAKQNKKKETIVKENNQATTRGEVEKIKKRIRKQVLSLNQQFLREYLYQQQPFNKLLVEINKCTNSGEVNERKINKLKKNIIECVEDRKREEVQNKLGKERSKLSLPVDKTKLKVLNQKKFMIEQKIDKTFEGIWSNLSKQIGLKVKMEGEYNWHIYGKKRAFKLQNISSQGK